MRTNKILRIFVWVAILIVALHSVMAIGITPSRKYVDYSPGLRLKIPMTVINAEHKDMQVLLYSQGELAQYIDLGQSMVSISSKEGEKEVMIELKLPNSFEKAGEVSAQIFALEFPAAEEVEAGSKVISARTAVASQIIVRIPYPGKYAEGGLYVEEGEVGEETVFTIPLMNLGTDPIVGAKADIIIYSAVNERIAEISTQEISIESKRQADLKASWMANVNPGAYYAVAVVDYDGKKIRLEKPFRVGKMMLELLGVDVSKFKLGDIAEFNIKLYNNWNQILESVSAEMAVKDAEGRTYTSFKTAQKDIDPLSTETLQAYWNTKGISVGPYKIDLVVYYAEQALKKTIDINVYPNEIVVNPLTAKAIGSSSEFNTQSMIFIVLIVLIAANIGWFVFFSRKLRKNHLNDSGRDAIQKQGSGDNYKNDQINSISGYGGHEEDENREEKI